MKKYIIILCYFIFIQLPVLCAHTYLEKEYQAKWCSLNNGKPEYKLPNLTRIDCLTPEYAVEFDFASKWAESIGQSLFYSMSTLKKPGVVLIMENGEKDMRYLDRLKTVAAKYGISVWTMCPEDLQ